MMLKAVPSPKHENDSLDDAFFDQVSIAPVEIDRDDDASAHWEAGTPLERGKRRAMHVTLGMLGASLVALGTFFVYTRVLMPTPVELGAASATLPTLPTLPPSAAAVANEIEPSVQPEIAHAAASEPAPAFEMSDIGAVVAPPKVAKKISSPARASGGSEDSLVKQAYRALNSGDPQRAIAQARRVVNASPERADAWLVIGSAYGTLQDRGSALLAFRACALHGKGPSVETCVKLARQ